jgi:hypothetical protein
MRTKIFMVASAIFIVVGLIAGLDLFGMLIMIGAAAFAIGSSILVSEQKEGRK